MERRKAKSAFKVVVPVSDSLRKKIRETIATIADIVGGTLGPGGRPVLIERQEFDLPPSVTKDGVSVFRALGFRDPVAHSILEAARDASVRTANEAGDGTTTATILSRALVVATQDFEAKNPKVSARKIVNTIQRQFSDVIEPFIKSKSIKADFGSPEGRTMLEAVATISANGDKELAKCVMRCYDICGDDGNITIVDASGPYGYQEEHIEGFPTSVGYEETCGAFYPLFINRPSLQQIVMDKPIFVLYFGRINDIQTLVPLMSKLDGAFQKKIIDTPNVVVVSTGFSENVIASLANNWIDPNSINILPMVVPLTMAHNGQKELIDDLAGAVAGKVFDPITQNDLDNADFSDLGNLAPVENTETFTTMGVTGVEVSRYRSMILGIADEDTCLERQEVVRAALAQSGSELDRLMTQERLAKLSGGIARLKVFGTSNADIKERRDRAEDAICAVRGAIKHGCLPGGTATLCEVSKLLDTSDPIVADILVPALLVPFEVLKHNAGILEDDGKRPTFNNVYDALNHAWVNPLETGILDSTPAVLEALRNAIGVATLLGTLGGCVVFPRDDAFDVEEAHREGAYQRAVSKAEYDPQSRGF
jgi:chaperonin GroEL